MSKQRIKMKLELDHPYQPPASLQPPYELHPIRQSHASSIGQLLFEAYTGTIDDEGETLEEMLVEAAETLSGKYGPLLADCSFMATVNGTPVSACVLSLFRGLPLVTYNMTHPAHSGRKLSTRLLERSIAALAKAGYPALYLVVTVGNHSAQHIYQKLGFQNYPYDWPDEA